MNSLYWIGALAAVPALVAPVQAQRTARGAFDPLNYSGLMKYSGNGELPIVTMPGGIGGLVGVASPIVSPKRGISAKVVEDRTGSLIVEVFCTGLTSNAMKLTAVVADAGGTRAVAGIRRASVNLTPGQPDQSATLTIALDAGAPEGTLESKRLFLFVTGSQPHIVAASQMFDCDKKWFKSPSILIAEPLSTMPPPPADPNAPPPPPLNLIKMIKFSEMQALRPGKSVLLKGQLMRGGQPSKLRDVPMQKVFVKQSALKNTSMLILANPAPPPAVAAPNRPIMIAKFNPEMISKLKLIDPATFAKPPQEVVKDGGEGPAALNIIGFAEKIDADANFVEMQRALSITPAIYGDKNKNSGFFYYLPARYVVDFADSNFRVQMFFSAGDGNSPGEVNVSIILKAAIDPIDLQIASTFLSAYCKTQSLPFKELKPFFGTPKASLEAALAAQLFIAPEKVKVLAVGENAVSVNIAASMDKFDLLLARLTSNLGLAGEMTYSSPADPALTAAVPMELRLPDRNSLNLNLTPQNLFKNDSPFPVALKYVHVLRFTGATPTVYTFDLPNNELAPGATATVDRSKIPMWLTAAPSKMWMDFTMVPDAASMDRALQAATIASSGQATANVTVEKVGEFPADVSNVTVVVSSKYFTPFGTREETKEFTFAPGETGKTLGPLYPRGRQENVVVAGSPYLKWQIKLTKAGKNLKTPLMESNSLTLSVGAEQIGAAK